jgi:hypothetical protein
MGSFSNGFKHGATQGRLRTGRRRGDLARTGTSCQPGRAGRSRMTSLPPRRRSVLGFTAGTARLHSRCGPLPG